MIALKRVKTLPAMMLAVEREEVSGGGPSSPRRAFASALERPVSFAGGLSATALFNRVWADGVEAGTEPGLLGDRAGGGGGAGAGARRREPRLRVRLGGGVVRLRCRLGTGLVGGADGEDQPRRGDHAGAGAPARGGG